MTGSVVVINDEYTAVTNTKPGI